jgi:alkanesulfonate monooxygenase SsuD/methylene tetrahydromethanopterin reductase-like flavin-dependent oxidoreductase (luciferase family)
MMAEPITTALIVGLAAQKFVEGASSEAGKKLAGQLWDAIATRFQGRKKTEENLATIELAKGDAPGAIAAVETVLAGEFVEDEEFAASLQALAQQIINIDQSRNQGQFNFEIEARGNARVNAVGNLDATTVNFGDQE